MLDVIWWGGWLAECKCWFPSESYAFSNKDRPSGWWLVRLGQARSLTQTNKQMGELAPMELWPSESHALCKQDVFLSDIQIFFIQVSAARTHMHMHTVFLCFGTAMKVLQVSQEVIGAVLNTSLNSFTHSLLCAVACWCWNPLRLRGVTLCLSTGRKSPHYLGSSQESSQCVPESTQLK